VTTLVQKAEKAFSDWHVEHSSPAAKVFLLALLLQRRWNK
jgi:hypothetical protein